MNMTTDNSNVLKPMYKTGFIEDRNVQQYYGHGKLLLSGEYFVMDGATSLALPTKVGQSMSVKYSASFEPILHWKSFDVNGALWLEAKFEFWRFDCLDPNPSKEILLLQKILRQARKQNSHFLRDNNDIQVETHLGFPLEWGLGSSSTLIYNIAQWAYISPFELLFQTYGGSGYDIACAQSEGPILYSRNQTGPNWSPTYFNPKYKDSIYFVYLGSKQETSSAIEYYESLRPFDPDLIGALSTITEEMLHCKSLQEFEFLITAHESIVSKAIKLKTVKELYFSDYFGEIKSLGAWGGDFVIATSHRGFIETAEYFDKLGFPIVVPFDDIILQDHPQLKNNDDNRPILQ
ncbi:MAG: GHMP kinase [Bacteriovoracaceae bacterium]|nr:GHMP kinase [Bacteriovoracaceae bacterium]